MPGSGRAINRDIHTFVDPSGDLGAGRTITVPAPERWIVETIMLVLTTDATVGNRDFEVEVARGASILGIWIAKFSISASSVRQVILAPGLPEDVSPQRERIEAPFPRLFLQAGDSFKIVDINLVSATDQLKITMMGEREFAI